MMQNFLAFRDSPIIPLRRSPQNSTTLNLTSFVGIFFHLFCSTNARVSKCVVGESGMLDIVCMAVYCAAATCCSAPTKAAAAAPGPVGITPTGSTRAPPPLGCICGCGDAGCDPGGGGAGDPMGVPAESG